MPKTIILVRHGETDYNQKRIIQGHLDIPLNDTGHAQARELASKLSKLKFDAIYSSDLKRAHQTAVYTAKILSQEIKLAPAIREHHLGDFQGQSWDEQHQAYHPLWQDFLASFNDPKLAHWDKHHGESITQFRARVAQFLAHLQAQHQDQTVAVFTHGGTIRRFLEVTKVLQFGSTEKAKNTETFVLTKTASGYQLETKIEW